MITKKNPEKDSFVFFTNIFVKKTMHQDLYSTSINWASDVQNRVHPKDWWFVEVSHLSSIFILVLGTPLLKNFSSQLLFRKQSFYKVISPIQIL